MESDEEDPTWSVEEDYERIISQQRRSFRFGKVETSNKKVNSAILSCLGSCPNLHCYLRGRQFCTSAPLKVAVVHAQLWRLAYSGVTPATTTFSIHFVFEILRPRELLFRALITHQYIWVVRPWSSISPKPLPE